MAVLGGGSAIPYLCGKCGRIDFPIPFFLFSHIPQIAIAVGVGMIDLKTGPFICSGIASEEDWLRPSRHIGLEKRKVKGLVGDEKSGVDRIAPVARGLDAEAFLLPGSFAKEGFCE